MDGREDLLNPWRNSWLKRCRSLSRALFCRSILPPSHARLRILQKAHVAVFPGERDHAQSRSRRSKNTANRGAADPEEFTDSGRSPGELNAPFRAAEPRSPLSELMKNKSPAPPALLVPAAGGSRGCLGPSGRPAPPPSADWSSFSPPRSVIRTLAWRTLGWNPLFGQVPGLNKFKSFLRLRLCDVGDRNTGSPGMGHPSSGTSREAGRAVRVAVGEPGRWTLAGSVPGRL